MMSFSSSSLNRPFVIFRRDLGCGFWSNFTCVLQGLDRADHAGLIPVVDMERHPTRYNEDDDELGTANAWEYYFAQPGSLSLKDALKLDPLDNDGSTEGPFLRIQEVRPSGVVVSRARELLRKYIRIKPEILAQADSVLPGGVNGDVLGVHVRGTDMRRGHSTFHAVSSPAMMYLDQAAQLDGDHSFSRVFLACDEMETVDLFRRHFGSRLVTLASHRTSADDPLSGAYQWLFEPRRKHHRYLLGLEVLNDALLLARCGHLVCGVSNVSQCAIYFSDERQTVHPVPPLWFSSDHRGPSMGKDFVEGFARPTHEPTAPALESQLGELRRLLEAMETDRARVLVEGDEMHERLVQALVDLGAMHERFLEAHRGTKTALREVAVLKKQLRNSAAVVERLQNRILKLINWWTWLGWRLMPWTKPAWRHHPLQKGTETERSSSQG